MGLGAVSEVYFIGPKNWTSSRVKIGRTRTGVHNRLAALQTGSPVELTVYGWVQDEGRLERALHDTFEPLRLHGEWFFLEYKLLDLVSHIHGYTDGLRCADNDEFWDAVRDAVMGDEVHSQWADDGERYLASADPAAMSLYMHDVAWSEYQASERG